jgi:small subunit ribosomal protein S6
MREYELTVVYDLSVAEAGGPEAGPQRLTSLVEARGGQVIKVDHWGRRRMAYPIGTALDGDYIVSRINFEPAGVAALEAALKIDERVFRHLVVRADELPPPPPPREPREPRPQAEAPAAPVAEAPAAATEATVAPPAPAAEAPEAPAAAEPVAEAPAAAVETAEAETVEAPSADAEPAEAEAEAPAEE